MLTSILLLFTGFLNPIPVTTDTSEWKKLDLPKFSIEYPSSWQAESYENATLEFTLTSWLEDEEDTYAEFVSLAILPLPGLNKNLDSYIAETIKEIPFTYKNAAIRQNEKTTKASKPCYILSYAGLYSDFPLSHLQYIWFENDTVFTLSYVAKQGSFERWEETARKIMDSFTFKQ
jgi:hypothetical protein